MRPRCLPVLPTDSRSKDPRLSIALALAFAALALWGCGGGGGGGGGPAGSGDDANGQASDVNAVDLGERRVEVQFTLSTPSSRDVSVDLEYSEDRGLTYKTATVAAASVRPTVPIGG